MSIEVTVSKEEHGDSHRFGTIAKFCNPKPFPSPEKLSEAAQSFTPLWNYALVAQVEEQEKTYGGIIVPETVHTTVSMGIVVNIGPDVLNLAVGDVILYGLGCGAMVAGIKTDFPIHFVNEEDILAILGNPNRRLKKKPIKTT